MIHDQKIPVLVPNLGVTEVFSLIHSKVVSIRIPLGELHVFQRIEGYCSAFLIPMLIGNHVHANIRKLLRHLRTKIVRRNHSHNFVKSHSPLGLCLKIPSRHTANIVYKFKQIIQDIVRILCPTLALPPEIVCHCAFGLELCHRFN